MDSRPLFALPPSNAAIIDAHKKKPRVPVHAIATANNPVVRFIGQPDDAVAQLAQQGVSALPKDNDAFLIIGSPNSRCGSQKVESPICLFILPIMKPRLNWPSVSIKHCAAKLQRTFNSPS